MKISAKNETKPNGKTTILLAGETRDLLKKLGKKGETYDEILNKLLEDREEKK